MLWRRYKSKGGKYIKISIIQAVKPYSVVKVCDLYLLSKYCIDLGFASDIALFDEGLFLKNFFLNISPHEASLN